MQFSARLKSLVLAVVTAVGLFIVPAPQMANALAPASFIAWVAPMAQAGRTQYGVPASVSIAQAILESGWGESRLTKDANNFFGIKCFATVSPWQDGCYEIATTEYKPDGSSYVITAKFRKYTTPERSFIDHGAFLTSNSRYAPAFAYTNNPDRFAYEIHKAGYATDPGYTSLLISLMRKYNLYQYDPPADTTPLSPSTFGLTGKTAPLGSQVTMMAAYYGDPNPVVTWETSKDKSTWTKVSSNITTYGYRSMWKPTLDLVGSLYVRMRVTNAKGQATSGPVLLTTTGVQPIRMGGIDRYATAVAISQQQFADASGPVVYLANGEGFADALSVSAAASANRGVVLLTLPGTLPAATRNELIRLAPSRIVVAGGTGAVSAAVATAARNATGVTPTRVSGTDRYQTAIAVARTEVPSSTHAIIASGEVFADALSAGSLLATRQAPLLLAPRVGGLPKEVITELARRGTRTVSVLGGTASVSSEVEAQLKPMGITVARLAGSSRYETSLAAAKAAFPTSAQAIYLTTGTNFPDGLALTPMTARVPGPVILTQGTCIPADLAVYLSSIKPGKVFVAGSESAVSTSVSWLRPCQ